jgi:magnesium-protoporphyrin O-methyltransferase
MSRPTEKDIGQYFDETVDCCAPRRDAGKRPGVDLAQLLRMRLREAGLENADVLELGCGRGELALELLQDGASNVVGFDLSSDAIEYAQRIAREDGVASRAEFRSGNAATADLPRREVVVHHRVICCYPDSSQLLANSIGAAGRMYAFSMPRSRGIWGLFVKVALRFENLIHLLKRRGFRAYVHDERIVESALTRAGFELHGRSNRRGWFAAVYVR